MAFRTFATMQLQEISTLIARDFKLEMRQKHSIGGVVLYVMATIFVAYLSFRQIVDPNTWNALFWIIVLFAAFNATAKSFWHDRPGLAIYWYTMAAPQSVILAKMVYNTLLMNVLGLLSLLFFVLFMGPAALEDCHWPSLFTAIVLGCTGLGSALTMIAAVASKTNNAFGIMAILGMPVILPLLLSIIRLSQHAMVGIALSDSWKNALFTGMITVISVTLAYVLFPYLWRD